MASAEASKGTFAVKVGLAQMLKGGVIMDVVNEEQARIAEEAGAVAGTQPLCFALLRTTAASASPGRRACRARVPTHWGLCAETHALPSPARAHLQSRATARVPVSWRPGGGGVRLRLRAWRLCVFFAH